MRELAQSEVGDGSFKVLAGTKVLAEAALSGKAAVSALFTLK